MIEALKELPNCHLALAGTGENEGSLRSLVASLGLDVRRLPSGERLDMPPSPYLETVFSTFGEKPE